MKRPPALLLVALLCAIIAGGGVLWLTRAPGPGLSPDTMSYLAAARSLARGDGPQVPFADWSDADSTGRLRDYPPGYPVAIAAGIRLGAAAEQSARWVMTLAAAASAFGVALMVGSVAGPASGALAALAVIIAPSFVEQHYVILSEPLFLALLVMLLVAMLAERPRALTLGLVSGAAVMVRYAGVSLPFAAALWCVTRPGGWRQRLTRGAIAAAPGAAAFILWSHWAGGVREYGWKGHLWPTVVEGWNTAQGWMAPPLSPSPMRVALTLVVLGTTAWLFGSAVRSTRERAGDSRRVLAASGLLASCYAGIVLISRLIADEAIPFDNRLLSPVFLLATVALVVAGALRWRASSGPARASLAVMLVLWFSGSFMVVRQEALDLAGDGWGYASADWAGSDLAHWLQADGRRYALFTDNPASVYSLTRRPSRRLDDKDDPGDDAVIGAALAAAPSAIIEFKDTETGEHGRTAVLAARLGYREVLRGDEGVVWVKPDGSAQQ